MAVGYRCHACQDDTHLWIGGSQRVHDGEVVFYELVAIVGPIAWVSIVYAEVHHGNIAFKGDSFFEFFLFYVGAMAVI